MKKLNYFHIYLLGFIFWFILLLIRLGEMIPYEIISQISAQIELFLHFFMLIIAFNIYTRSDSNEKK